MEMNKQQLAEKVANDLGWQEDESVGVVFDNKLPAQVFSWPVTGLIIEEMAREGWFLSVDSDKSLFFSYWERGAIGKTTESYYYEEQGYHIAIAQAFIEAKEIINES